MQRLSKSLTRKITWTTAVQCLGKVVQVAIGIVTVKLVTGAIGVEQYGMYGKIAEYVLFFSVAANLGIFGNMVRKMSEAPRDSQLFFNALVLRVGTALICFGTGALYAWLFISDSVFLLGMLFFMASLFFDYVSSVASAMLLSNYWMGRSVLAVTLGRFTELGLIFLLVQVEPGMAYYFLAPLGAAVVSLGLSLAFVRHKMPLTGRLQPALIQELFLTSLPFGIINLLNNLYFRFLPSYLAARFLSNTQFGSYSVQLNIAITVSLFSTFLMYAVLPGLKRSLAEGHLHRAHTLYKKVRLLLVGISALTIGVGTLLAPFAIRLVSDDSFLLPEFTWLPTALLILASVSYFYDLVLLTNFALEDEIWFLKTEILALAVAGAFFLTSFALPSTLAQLGTVLLGALAGELTIVLLASRKIRLKAFHSG